MRFFSLLLILLFSLLASEVNGQSYSIDTGKDPAYTVYRGYIFKLKAKSSVLVESFLLRGQSEGNIIVYYKEGSYDLNTTSLADMTILSNTKHYNSGNQNIPVDSYLLLQSGKDYTFFFLSDTRIGYYPNHTDEIVVEDNNLIIYKGNGLDNGLLSESTQDRAFAGAINYKIASPIPTISEIWFFVIMIGLAAFGVYFVVVRQARVLTV